MPQKNSKKPFTEPGTPSPEGALGHAVRTFVAWGCDSYVASWLVPLLAKTLPSAPQSIDTEDGADDPRIQSLASVWFFLSRSPERIATETDALLFSFEPSAPATRDTGLLATLSVLMGELYAPRIDGVISDDAAIAVAREMLAHGADFRTLLSAGWPPYLVKELLGSPFDPSRARETRVCRVLVQAGAIDQSLADALTAPYPSSGMAQLPDMGASPGAEANAPQSSLRFPLPGRLPPIIASLVAGPYCLHSSDSKDAELRAIEEQILHGTLGDLRAFRAIAATCADERFTAVVYTIANAAATRWANSEGLRRFDIYDGHSPEWFELLRAFGREMRVYFELADARVPQNPSAASPDLRTLWMLLFRMGWDADRAACPEKTRKRMIDAARADIAALRQVLEKADKAGDTPEAQQFVQQLRHLRRCASLLAFHGSVFQMLKPMLLALRKLKTPAVAHDLRDWDEFEDDPPPKPWRELPAMISAVFHATVGREQAEDPDLEKLRGEFGAFCLERLTDRWKEAERKAALESGRARENEDMTEPSPEWRYAYVRAAAALRINPDGKGHRTLHMAASLDPDSDVKDAARAAEQLLRHQGRLPERVSPRRAVMTAIWFLKQAHLRALDVYVDADGAQRTRIKELTRTKEVERADD